MGNFEQKNFHGKELYTCEFGGLMEFGNYTKSQYNFTKAQNVFVQNCFTYSEDKSNWPDEDYRSVSVVDFDVEGKSLEFSIIMAYGPEINREMHYLWRPIRKYMNWRLKQQAM